MIGALGRADQRAERADHRQNARDVALVEDMDGDAGAHEVGCDIGLQVGEGEHEIRLAAPESLGMSAEMKAETRGFSRRTCGGRTA